jgi:fructose PTS system EIIBC or EIIC component
LNIFDIVRITINQDSIFFVYWHVSGIYSDRLIRLDVKATTKATLFEELIDVLDQEGRLHDKQQFLSDIYAREGLGNIGFDDGVAIPHAKSSAVKEKEAAVVKSTRCP